MKVNIQENNVECGICVLKSIYEYTYKDEIEKSQILGGQKINDGLSIYDMETLANKINIQLESYKIEFDKFKDLKINQYFITIFKNEFGNHYVICKKNKTNYLIFDSIKGKYELDNSTFEKLFHEVIIFFKAKQVKENLQEIKNIKIFDIPNNILMVSTFVIFDILILFFVFIGNNLLNIAINFLENNIFTNFLFLIIFFLFVFLIENFSQYFINILKTNRMEEISKRNIVFYINYLQNKNLYFFKNTDKALIYSYPILLANILKYQYIDKPMLYSNFIFSICITFFISFLSYLFLLVCIIYLIINTSLFYFLSKYEQKRYYENNILKNELDYHFFNLYKFLENEKNIDKFNFLSERCKKYYWKNSEINYQNTKFYLFNETSRNLLKKIINLIIISLSIYFILEFDNKYLNIADIVLIFSLIHMLDNSLQIQLSAILNKKVNKNNIEKLDSFLNTFNKNNNENNKLEISNIYSIKIENLNFSYENKILFSNKTFYFKNKTLLTGENGIGKSTLFRIISLDIDADCNYQVNNLSLNEYNIKSFENNICYLPSDCTFSEVNYSLILERNYDLKNEIAKFLRITKISEKKESKCSKGELQLMNLMKLLEYRNKLILLDETFSNISKENLDLFMKHFFNRICKHNFVLCISHSKHIKKYFDNNIVIC